MRYAVITKEGMGISKCGKCGKWTMIVDLYTNCLVILPLPQSTVHLMFHPNSKIDSLHSFCYTCGIRRVDVIHH